MADSTPFLWNIWYYALPGHQLKPGKTIAKVLLNEPIVFGRTLAGQVFALRDICPHRAIPLSYGRFDGHEVECAYHGWRFSETGQCTQIPALTDDQHLNLDKFGVRAYPVQEVQGNIWIYMSSGAPSDTNITLQVPRVPGFEQETYRSVEGMNFPCFIDHAVVGLMDPAHVPFVHRSWWWRADDKLAEEVKTFDPSPYGFTMRKHQLERETLLYRLLGRKPAVEISFQLPGVRIEQVTSDRHTVCNLTTLTPLTETSTEVTTLFYTSLPWFKLLVPILSPLVQRFLDQDRQMVIKQQDGLKYNPSLMLIKDADTQARWYYQLKSEFARSVEQGRSFENPVREQVLRWRS
ncbi:aromatic ring-hydroxylating oxygenase subunit alpha [Myxacorys almedinensis]|uniref:Rieske 2Fe-2S domain-containing protein n=1 Tax=Myxacorys almedinensis A TaxID=2690445 RepID=A0A8J7Z1T4_9CYAN|nr:aromatic ring-hydroxylating dioxygenase subunit alpha [Myxacorys almedinensis]NDJ16226.1 Rieske 2Fe-2S domain-containing protein [Myxacorys almedinensis A]